MLNVMLSNTRTGRVIIKGGYEKRFGRRLHCGFRESGTSVWLLQDQTGVAGDGVGEQVEAKMKTILNVLLGKSSFTL